MEQETAQKCGVCGMVSATKSHGRVTEVITESDVMKVLLRSAARCAASDAPLVIQGETGTGKEVVARIVHANSPRAKRPFVAVNVAALPPDLLESELFGHGRGAFTGATGVSRGLFEAADGGTLFLDEIGEMPLALQAKMLRALQDGEIRRVGETRSFEVDVHVICATHRDLATLVEGGKFREDLFYRLKVLSLHVPPLRERADDIMPLARHFLADEGCCNRRFAKDAEACLRRYRWPGNVRELHNVVRHGSAMADGAKIRAADLPAELSCSASWSPSIVGAAAPAHRTLAEVERDHIERVLADCGGSQSEASRVLGIGRNTLWRRLRAYAEADSPEPVGT